MDATLRASSIALSVQILLIHQTIEIKLLLLDLDLICRKSYVLINGWWGYELTHLTM